MENELSIFVAKIIGVIYTVMSIGVLMGTISYTKMFKDIEKTPAILPLMSLFGIVIGMLLIEYHNIWVWDWPVMFPRCAQTDTILPQWFPTPPNRSCSRPGIWRA